MFAQERHHAIKKLVREHRRLNFADLQAQIRVSPATLRRDLTDLEQAGELIRVHGGVMHPSYARAEISFDDRVLRNHSAKLAIAPLAASLIPAGASVFVDAGSTCLEAGKILSRRKDVRLVTHSVALLAETLHGEAEVLSIGGELRHVSGALTGGHALDALGRIHADFALLGASGLTDKGLWTTELSEAEMKQAILSASTKSFLLADFSKWTEPSTVRFADWSQISAWVTNTKPTASIKRSLPSALVFHVAKVK